MCHIPLACFTRMCKSGNDEESSSTQPKEVTSFTKPQASLGRKNSAKIHRLENYSKEGAATCIRRKEEVEEAERVSILYEDEALNSAADRGVVAPPREREREMKKDYKCKQYCTVASFSHHPPVIAFTGPTTGNF